LLNSKIAVLGGGSFGTALANVLADNEHLVSHWMRNAASAEEINTHHRNTRFFPDLSLNPNIKATTDLAEALSGADQVYVVVPSAVMRSVLAQCESLTSPEQIWISCTKGVERDTFMLMSEVIHSVLPDVKLGVLSGPNFAAELIQQLPTATVIASADEAVCEAVQTHLANSYFRVYNNSDIYGVELAGALKNIYAIATGMADAAGTKENTKSMLITRSLAEMSRFAHTLGANPMTFLGLAGVGDLLGTCSSALSRNYRVGHAIGSGESLDKVLANLGQTAEGVNTVKSVKLKADEMNVYMPLVSGLYEILFESVPWQEVVSTLMGGDSSKDVEFVAN